MRVLISYASRFGSTRDIANRIAEAVRKDGNDVDLRSGDEISDFDRYDAVVFGSGVYDRSWTMEATELMRRHAAILARRPVWLFSVGSFGDRHPIVGGLMKKEPKEIRELARVQALGGRTGDNRQWPDIDAWAETIAQELRRREETLGFSESASH